MNPPITINPSHPLAMLIPEIAKNYDRAVVKHGDRTLDGPGLSDIERLAALVEEVGEVAELFTYDHTGADEALYKAKIRAELMDVANVCLTWVRIL
jgi:hypothetical protein